MTYFIKPKPTGLKYFFKVHPIQPCNDSTLPFNSIKAFIRKNKTVRTWCTYDKSNKKMFCSVCLAFSVETNPFVCGMTDWKHIYQRITEHENSKSHVQCCEAYFMHCHQKDIGSLLNSNQMHLHREEVKRNRQILERIIEVIKIIGKRGLSVRAKRNEAAYFLKDPALDHGTFLEMIMLLSKYDAVLNEHLNTIISKSENNHLKGSKGRGNFVTFLSHYSIDIITSTISLIIKQIISEQISIAGMFSVLIDTTQDVSVMDQCSIVIRYVFNGKINEKLIGVKCCTESTGKGMMELLQSAMNEVNIDTSKCIGNATDGAANMQGAYNGFTSWLSRVAPEQIHVWCFSHILNLVICDATKNPVMVGNFFSLINGCAVFFKESYKRMNIWRNISENNNENIRHKRLQQIGDTRWTSKQTAVNRIFGMCGMYDEAMYPDLIIALSKICSKESFTPDIRTKASNLLKALLKYETILIAHIFMKIFSITGPLSRYLQTSGLDILKCIQMVEVSLNELRKNQRSMELTKNMCTEFISKMNDTISTRINESNEDLEIEEIHSQFEVKRISRKKKIANYEAADDTIINVEKKFTVDVYNRVFDTIIQSMNNRFTNNKEILLDLTLLSPTHFDSFVNGLPENAFSKLAIKLKPYFDEDNENEIRNKLCEEILSFSKSWKHLKKSVDDEYTEELYLNSDIENEDEDISKPCKTCKNCSICCYNVLIKYNLYSNAYPTLSIAYQYLLTLPVTQVACERSFSTLKYLKNRLRNSMTTEHLESFMLMAIEKQILYSLDNDMIINKVGEKSKLLSKLLS